MQGPEQLRLKRKRNEPAPDTLIVEPHHKRAFTDNARTQLQYVRQQDAGFKHVLDAEAAFSKENLQQKQRTPERQSSKVPSRPGSKDGKRTFHLTHARASEGIKKHKKSKEHTIATFVEKRIGTDPARKARSGRDAAAVPPPESQPFKRPGTASAVSGKGCKPPEPSPKDAQQRKHMESLANDLHRFALDELANAPKPKLAAVPKLSAARSRDLHRQRAAVAESRVQDQDMVDVDEDGDYVYDTYVLTSGGPGAVDTGLNSSLGDVGYLIITEEDESVWETYIEDEPSDKDWNTDEEDENAEDYYGAEYPEEELASDDEFDRNAYGYRRNGGSDDEEWDEHTGAYSDDEHERATNPWKAKTPKQFAEYLNQDDQDD